MHNIQRLAVAVGILLAAAQLTVFGALAQGDDLCPVDIVLLMTAAQDHCMDLPENTACVGSPEVAATFADPSTSVPFEAAGDQAALDVIDTITTLPFDPATGNVGIAIITMQRDDGTSVTLTQIGAVETSGFDVAGGSLSVTTTPDDSACGESIDSVLVLEAGTSGAPAALTINGVGVMWDGIVVVETVEDALRVTVLTGDAMVTGDAPEGTVIDAVGVPVPFDTPISVSDLPDDSFAGDLMDALTPGDYVPVAGSDIVPEDGVFAQAIVVVCPEVTQNFGDDVFYTFEFDGSTFTISPEGVDPLVYTPTGLPGVYYREGVTAWGTSFVSWATIVSNDQWVGHIEQSDGCVVDAEFNRVAE